MDSLTQITLGAAVGELTLGKKVGNRAMMWGAVAGTIPDLDVISGLWMSPLNSLTFHRGPSHSITFAVLFPLLIASYTHWLYRNDIHKKRGFKIAGFSFGVLFISFILFILGGMSSEFFGAKGMAIALAMTVPVAVYFIWRMYRFYLQSPSLSIDTTWRDWYILFFWAIVTHSILDCFTVFGTVFLWPFSHERVAFSNISVADPMYTFPFLTLLIVAAFLRRGSAARFRVNLTAIVLSSLYMCLTLFNQQRVEKVVENTLEARELHASRILVTPTILNNVLWYCVAEVDSFYYQGLYSFYDEKPEVQLSPVPMNRDLLAGHEFDRTVKKLAWFSDGMYALMEREDGRRQWNDMRYGTFRGISDSEKDYIFYFILEEGEDGKLEMEETDPGPPEGEAEGMMTELWNRIFAKEPAEQ